MNCNLTLFTNMSNRNLAQLDSYLLLNVLEFLSIQECIDGFGLSCKNWHLVVNDDRFWESNITRAENRSLMTYFNRDEARVCDLRHEFALPSMRILYNVLFYELVDNSARLLHSSIDKEEPPVGCDIGPAVSTCFASSYDWGTLVISIPQLPLPIERSLRNFQSKSLSIRFSFWFASRFDQASRFRARFKVTIEGNILESSLPEYSNDAGTKWRKYIWFLPLPFPYRNVQSISFFWQGKDRQWWSGNYGAKIANVSIRFVPFEEMHMHLATTNNAIIEDADPHDCLNP